MLEDNIIIEVTNRDNGSVGYSIPDLRIQRTFQSGETKKITMEELRKLSYVPGGSNILKKYLVLNNKDAIEELIGDVEPEYYYTKEDVENLLLRGSLDQFKDCLDFAPKGIIDMVKEYSVKLKLNDVLKREALKEKTGFDVTSAISIEDQCSEDEVGTETKQRRAAAINAETEPKQRRTSTQESRYKIVK